MVLQSLSLSFKVLIIINFVFLFHTVILSLISSETKANVFSAGFISSTDHQGYHAMLTVVYDRYSNCWNNTKIQVLILDLSYSWKYIFNWLRHFFAYYVFHFACHPFRIHLCDLNERVILQYLHLHLWYYFD